MNYTQTINATPVVLVEFYATWCPHCRNMAPVILQLKDRLDGQVEVVQLDIDKNTELGDSVHVDVYPTFIIYRDGKEVWRDCGEIDLDTLLAKVRSHQ